jgi:hypothetical protein
MEISKKLSGRNIATAVGLMVIFGVAFALVLKAYRNEGEKRSAVISESGEKDPNHIEIFVKLVAVDPIKGDVTARVEFIPHGNLTVDEGGTVTKDLKLFVNSATGKQEHVFEKGKRMNPVDVTLSLYDGLVTDYPFDEHKAYLQIYLENAAKEKKEAPKPQPTPQATPQPEGEEGHEDQEAKPAQAAKTEEPKEEDGLIPMGVDFYGSIHGLKIQAEKSQDSDDSYVEIDMTFSRATTVKFFSIFVMIIMWGVTIIVLLMTFSIAMRGRKIEVGLFSLLATLIFSFVALRNAQPGSPPIGCYSDYLSFFWAEILIALSLLTIISVWLLRPTPK